MLEDEDFKAFIKKELSKVVLTEEELLTEKERLEKKLSKAEEYIKYASSLSDFNSRDEKLSEIKCIYFPLPQYITGELVLGGYLKQKTISYGKGPNIPMQHYFKEDDYPGGKRQEMYVMPCLYFHKAKLPERWENLTPNQQWDAANLKLNYLLNLDKNENKNEGKLININEKSYNGMTALMHLFKCRVPSKEMISVLLAHNPDVNVRDDKGMTALLYAVMSNQCHIDVIELFLAHNADVNVTDENGMTALLYAVIGNQCGIGFIKLFLAHNADVNVRDEKGKTALIYATEVERPDVAVIQLLIGKGADVKIKDNRGMTALMYAVRGFPEIGILDLLIKNGADVQTKDSKGMTVFMHSAYCSNDARSKIDTDYGMAESVIKFLIDKGGNLKHRDDKGLTVLMHYVIGKNVDSSIELIIDAGGTVSDLDNQNMTVLMHHLRCNPDLTKTSLLLTLMENNAINVNAKDINGMTALMHFVSGYDYIHPSKIKKTLILLIKNGCSIGDVDQNKMPVLMDHVSKMYY
jgi:ankyrin repeat protein